MFVSSIADGLSLVQTIIALDPYNTKFPMQRYFVTLAHIAWRMVILKVVLILQCLCER